MAANTGKGKAQASKGGGFKSFAVHITEDSGDNALTQLKNERRKVAAFGLASSQPNQLDPESAAKRILQHALDSNAAPGLVAPKVGDSTSDFKSLGVETIPLTGTTIVKFRQQLDGVPIYGSLVSVELDDKNEAVSINSNMAKPNVKSHVASIAPSAALKTAGQAAGYGAKLPSATPTLNFYLDSKSKWHLAYIVENVSVLKLPKAAKKPTTPSGHAPLVYDYVIDALSGALVASLPRTPSADTATGVDELKVTRTFGVTKAGAKIKLQDPVLNVVTYDFGWKDPQGNGDALPGAPCQTPPGTWKPAAISAHINAAAVASFLRDVLKRNNIDNKGGAIVSSVNCVVAQYEDPPGSKVWLNAFWDPVHQQMVYGQATVDGKLRSLSSALDVVAHELTHGITDNTSKLEYQGESGALNESYSDIFGIIVSNFTQADIGKWNWLIGDGIASGISALRDFQDPTKYKQPKLMKNFVQTSDDFGGVHGNSGIHNFAAYGVMTARDAAGKYLFKASEMAAMFYIALTQQLSRQSTFSDSRRGVVLATRSLFRGLPAAGLSARVAAVEAGFNAAGIK